MSPYFSSFPLELKLNIAEHASPAGAALLALTTTDLYYSPKFSRVWRPYQDTKAFLRELLSVLASDVPSLTYCDYCCRFHPRRSTHKICMDPFRHSSCPGKTSGMWLHYFPWHFHIQFEDVYKVMSRHRWGPQHGEPLDSLTVHTGWRPLHMRVGNGMQKLDVTALIVDDSLVLETTQRIWHDGQQKHILRTNLARHPFRCCQHWNDGCHSPTQVPSNAFSDFVEAEIMQKNPHPSARRSRFPQRCTRCLTEYTFSAWNHGERGIEIAMQTWSNLGPCKERTSIEWSIAASNSSNNNNNNNDRDRRLIFVAQRPRYVSALSKNYLTRECNTEMYQPILGDASREHEALVIKGWDPVQLQRLLPLSWPSVAQIRQQVLRSMTGQWATT